MAAQVRRGQLPNPDDDDLATKYEMADDAFNAAGLSWYEISNWARGEEFFCHHNVNYWQGGDWWGIGPGAHSHIGGMRWWNVKHPSTYAQRLSSGESTIRLAVQPQAGKLWTMTRANSMMCGYQPAWLW